MKRSSPSPEEKRKPKPKHGSRVSRVSRVSRGEARGVVGEVVKYLSNYIVLSPFPLSL